MPGVPDRAPGGNTVTLSDDGDADAWVLVVAEALVRREAVTVARETRERLAEDAEESA